MELLPRGADFGMDINGELFHVKPGADVVVRSFCFPVLHEIVEKSTEPPWVGGGAADLAQFPQRDFRLCSCFLILEVHADRDGAEGVVTLVIRLVLIEVVL